MSRKIFRMRFLVLDWLFSMNIKWGGAKGRIECFSFAIDNGCRSSEAVSADGLHSE